jgi:hypothetical protein
MYAWMLQPCMNVCIVMQLCLPVMCWCSCCEQLCKLGMLRNVLYSVNRALQAEFEIKRCVPLRRILFGMSRTASLPVVKHKSPETSIWERMFQAYECHIASRSDNVSFIILRLAAVPSRWAGKNGRVARSVAGALLGCGACRCPVNKTCSKLIM